MSILNNSLLLGADAGGAAGYQISRSLRFNSSDSAYLSRTPSTAGNRKTWTWAGWVKNCASTATTYPVTFLSARNAGNSGLGELFWVAINNVFTLSGFQIAAGNGAVNYCVTTAFYRDPSSWYHVVIAYDSTQATAANRFKLYVNGLQVTQFDTDNRASITQNSDGAINRTSIPHYIGDRTGVYGNCYLADIHFIDGQALTPSSFTEVSATTGRLEPKAYSGPTPTGNSFWLPFSDNSAATATTLGKDNFNLGNNWTPNNLSVTAGAGNDSLVDTPTSYGTDTGAGGEVRGNYATQSRLDSYSTIAIANGNLDIEGTDTAWRTSRASIGVSSGKWYWEATIISGAGGNIGIGLGKSADSLDSYPSHYFVYTAIAASDNNVLGLAFNADSGLLEIYKNGVKTALSVTGLFSGPYFPALIVYGDYGGTRGRFSANFGQRPFAYTAPSGFKALCDTNLPAPVVAKPSTAMDVKLYTGNTTGQTVSGLEFSPDLVWFKSRSAAYSHQLFDSVRGGTASLISNNTAAEVARPGAITSFNSNGFTIGDEGGINDTNVAMVAWCFDAGSNTVSNTQGSITSSVRANPSSGFSIVTWTGTGAVGTIGHGLGVAPGMVIVKSRSSTDAWYVFHSSLGPTKRVQLNETSAETTGTSVWNSTSPTSTVFSIGSGNPNSSGVTYVAYCFAPVAGYSSFGSYTGNGSADGPFVYTGFRPRWVMWKSSSVGGSVNYDWVIQDTARATRNVIQTTRLSANTANSESSDVYVPIDILSNGFKMRGTGAEGNGNTNTYIYAAFAESPFAYSRAR